MLTRIWKRFLAFFGLGPDEEDRWEEDAYPEREEGREAGRKGAVVPLPLTAKDFKMLVVTPSSFDEVQGIVDQLKGRRPVILNVQTLDRESAQQVLHFLGGAIYALGGETQKIAAGTFVFAPPNVDITTLNRNAPSSLVSSLAQSELGQAWLREQSELHPPATQGRPSAAKLPGRRNV